MIMSTRIPMLTGQFRAATLKAMDEQRRHTEAERATEVRLVRRLERLGYTVRLERKAA